MSETLVQLEQEVAVSAPKASLTHQTARGFAWLLVDTCGSKVVNFVGQILLARLLLPEHWGLIGLVSTVAVFADLASNAGLREVLIQRHNRFDRWVNAAAWMSLVLGLLGGLVMAAAAPLASWFYDSPRLPPLMYVTAVSILLASIGNIPEAMLRAHLRFRAVSVINLSRNLAITVLSVLFAWKGMGAFSFVLPRMIVFAISTVMLWKLTRPQVKRDPQWRRWRFLMGDTGMMLGAALLTTVIGQGGYILLGHYQSESVVGTYFFAYNLSLQTAVLFGLNLASVLLPALSKLQDDQPRLLAAFVRAARLVAMMGVPLCLLQAAVAGPAIRAVFGQKWLAAIPVLQILSLSMAWMMTWNSSKSLLQAQGRFRAYVTMMGVYALVFLTVVTIAANVGEAVAVSIATAAFFTLAGPIDAYIAIRGAGGRWRDVWSIYLIPFTLSLLTIGPTALLAERIPEMPGRDLTLLLGVPLVGLSAYGLAVRLMLPDVWSDLVQRIKGVSRGRSAK